MTEAVSTHTADDTRLLALLAEAREAEAEILAACRAAGDVDELENVPTERLDVALQAMADTPAASLIGIAAKAARLCRSLGDSGFASISCADKPVAESLAADLARLAPEARA